MQMGIKHSEHMKRRWAKIEAHERSDMLSRVARSKWSKTSMKDKMAHMKAMREAKKK
jgi:hypothetical protein